MKSYKKIFIIDKELDIINKIICKLSNINKSIKISYDKETGYIIIEENNNNENNKNK